MWSLIVRCMGGLPNPLAVLLDLFLHLVFHQFWKSNRNEFQ